MYLGKALWKMCICNQAYKNNCRALYAHFPFPSGLSAEGRQRQTTMMIFGLTRLTGIIHLIVMFIHTSSHCMLIKARTFNVQRIVQQYYDGAGRYAPQGHGVTWRFTEEPCRTNPGLRAHRISRADRLHWSEPAKAMRPSQDYVRKEKSVSYCWTKSASEPRTVYFCFNHVFYDLQYHNIGLWQIVTIANSKVTFIGKYADF